MKHRYVIGIDGSGIDEALQGIAEWKRWLDRKTEELAKRLAENGYEVAMNVMANHVFDGDTIASLRVEQVGPSHYVVKAESAAILFLEFGSGIRGGGHPEPNGFGPGTYPGQKNALNPKGWWFPTDDPRLIVRTTKDGQGWGHSYGMTAAMPMYNAVKETEQELTAIVQEVFGN